MQRKTKQFSVSPLRHRAIDCVFATLKRTTEKKDHAFLWSGLCFYWLFHMFLLVSYVMTLSFYVILLSGIGFGKCYSRTTLFFGSSNIWCYLLKVNSGYESLVLFNLKIEYCGHFFIFPVLSFAVCEASASSR